MPTATNGTSGSALCEPQALYIDGIYRNSSDNATFPVNNPMTGEKIYDCASATVDDYASAIESAHEAYASWSKTGPSARRLIFLKAADILESYINTDAPEILSSEVSATKSWIKVNIFATAGIFRESAGLATHIKGEIVPADRPGTTILVAREAVGVVFAISPWNAPVSIIPKICCRENTAYPEPNRRSGKSDSKGDCLPYYLRQHSRAQAFRIQSQVPASCDQSSHSRRFTQRGAQLPPHKPGTSSSSHRVRCEASKGLACELHWQ